MIEVNIFASFLILFLFLLLFFRKDNALPNRILGLTFLTAGLNFMDNIVILSGAIYYFPWSFFLVQITSALFAPLGYYYILLMTGEKNPKEFRYLKAATVFIILLGIVITARFAYHDAAGKAGYLHRLFSGPYPGDMETYSIILFIHQLLYFTFNYFQVKRFKNRSKEHLSSLNSVKIAYLFRLVALSWLLTLVTVLLYLTIDTLYVEYVGIPVVVVAVLLYIVYSAFHQNAVFTHAEYQFHLNIAVSPQEKKEEKETAPQMLNLEEAGELFRTIISYIETTESYKSPLFSIEKLSAGLDIPIYKLNESIRSNGVSFYELIRKIRVEKAKEILENDFAQYSIEGVAQEVGFNSRSSFYRAFKKYSQKEPSSYGNTHKNT